MATLATLLKEALFDEKRIVTYMYLSRRGNVSCVEAIKTMKELYNERKDGDQLNAVYSLIGQLKANGSRARRVMLVREDKLETTKSTFEKVISCDIYSLQTSVVRNLNILYGIDKADEEEYADQDAANSMVRCTQLSEEGRRARSVTPLLWSSSDEESIVAAVVKVEKQASETKAKTTVRPPVAKQSSLSAAFAKNKPLPPLEKPTVSKDEEPPAAKAKPVRSEKRPTASPEYDI
uniref:DNA polymerase delta subunit 3 n=1 Tax=Plectus sambesii TaxID=2011161 RepID=A0A914WT12_9BILA